MKIYKALLLTGLLAITCGNFAFADFSIGDRGDDVLRIQQRLIKAGFRTDADGIYGKDTAWAVRKFQKKRKLDVDGVVGPATYKALVGKQMPKKVSKSARSSERRNEEGSRSSGPITWGSSSNMTGREREVTNEARKYIGIPYRFGGEDTSGFDCSGFIQYVFSRQGIQLPRSADEQYASGRYVSVNSLEPGDLVFFSTYTEGVSHSGIYMGDGRFISATSSRGIAVDDMKSGYWFDRYVGAKRVL